MSILLLKSFFYDNIDYLDKDPEDIYQDNVGSKYIDRKIEEHFLYLDDEILEHI